MVDVDIDFGRCSKGLWDNFDDQSQQSSRTRLVRQPTSQPIAASQYACRPHYMAATHSAASANREA